MAGIPQGNHQRVGEGVEYPRGIDTLRVEELPRGGGGSVVTPKRDRLPKEDGRGWAGDRNPPTTQETEARGDSKGDKEMTSGPAPSPSPPLIPQRGTAADRGSTVRPYRHLDGANGARPKHASKYGLLVRGRGGGGGVTKRAKEGHPPSSVRCLRTACRRRRWGGDQESEGGAPSDQEHTPSVQGLIQEIGGGSLDLQRPLSQDEAGMTGKQGNGGQEGDM